MGGKSRKRGQVSHKLIEKLTGKTTEKKNCGKKTPTKGGLFNDDADRDTELSGDSE